MYCQSRSLYERLVTPSLWADVGPVAAMYPFYRGVLAILPMNNFECLYHDEQDHSFVQSLYRKYCMQKLSRSHYCFAVSCRSHQDQLPADLLVVAAAA